MPKAKTLGTSHRFWPDGPICATEGFRGRLCSRGIGSCEEWPLEGFSFRDIAQSENTKDVSWFWAPASALMPLEEGQQAEEETDMFMHGASRAHAAVSSCYSLAL